MFGTQTQNQGQPQGAGLFGQPNQNTFQNQTPAQGGMFGAAQPQAAQPNQGGGGMFGAANNQNKGAFGSTNNNSSFLGGQQPNRNAQGQGGVFGAPQTQAPQQGGIFGQQPAVNGGGGGGIFGAPAAQPAQGGFNSGMAGTAPAPQGQGMFGQQTQNAAQGQSGFFGQQNNNTAGGAGGAGGGGIFGAPTNAGSQPFGAQPQQPGVFGGTGGTSPFGAQNTQPAQQQGSAGLFGASQPNQQQVMGAFGATTQQQQPNQAGSLFGSFAPSNTQPAQQGQSVFGAPAPAQNQNAGSAFGFGGASSGTGGLGTNANNKLGGTSWGVPTNQAATNSGQPFQPVRSKNPKLDAKHLVKSITAVEQFIGFSKEELRISFVQNGGQQPALNQPGGTGTAANNFAKPQNAPLTSIPSFGGSTNLGAGGTSPSLFGGQPATGGGILGGAQNKPPGQPSLFGAAQPAPGGAFGASNSSSMFGQTPQQPQTAFGGQSFAPQMGATNPAQPSLFGGQPAQPAQPQSMFGQTTQPAAGGSLFGAIGAPAPALGQAQPSAPSLFGAAPSALQAPPSLFSTPASAPTQFAPQTPQAINPIGQPGMSANPSMFSQLASPLYQQPQQQMDPAMQLLLPQLLLNAVQNQPQTPGQVPSANPTMDLVNRLIANMNPTKPADQNTNTFSAGANFNLLAPTPFDEFLKEDANNKWLNRSQQKQSLFSEAEVREFEDLDARSYVDRIHHHSNDNETFKLKHSHKPSTRRPDPLGETNYKIINRNYKNTQEKARSKYTPSDEDLPDIGKFTLEPSRDRLKAMTINQLKKVEHVKVSNIYGTVEFMEPISLYKMDLVSAIKICQDNIEILDPELEEKKVQMTFVNFGGFRDLKSDERTKLLKRMRMWIDKFEMEQVHHDDHTGELTVVTLE